MKLQLALDVLEMEKAISLASMTRNYVDIIEIGTPLIKHEGIGVVKALKRLFPEKEILVDTKTMDVGEYEADFCFNAGADIVTVLGVADLETIKGSIKSARKHNGKVMVDLINVHDKCGRAREVEEAGADFIGIHSGIDQQNNGHTPLMDLATISGKVNIPVFVAGGINLKTVDSIVEKKPRVVVVGGAITSAENPEESARMIKERLK
jgi:3-hexulose-6-phosphate synthase